MSNKYAIHCPRLPWMVDFYNTGDGTIPTTQLKAAYAENHIEYVTNLNIESELPKKQLTSIICSIGPSSNDVETMEKMMKAGMRVARINMSFYNVEECIAIIRKLKSATNSYSKKTGRLYPLAIAIDIKGAEIRTGTIKSNSSKSSKDSRDILLQEGATVSITSDPQYAEQVTEDMIYVDYQKLPDVVEPGDELFLDEGNVRLSALEIVGSIIRCLIENVGRICDKALLEAPGIPIDLPFLSEKDIADLKYCASQNVDVVMVPIANIENVRRVREELGNDGKDVLIFAKISNVEGVHNLDDILKEVDGIVLIRSRIIMEAPKEKLYIIQKSIIGKCNKLGIPVICAPQMLESMAVNPRPTNAEVSDVSNAVLDGADGILLSRETSVGKYPVETVETLAGICRESEPGVYQKQLFETLVGKFTAPIEIIHSLAMHAVECSMKVNAAVIVVTTTTGRTAKLIAKYRPRCPILAISRHACVTRRLHLYRAIDPLQHIKPPKADWNKELMKRVQLGVSWGKYNGFIQAGDAIVMVISPQPSSGFTNSIKVVYASEFDTLRPAGNPPPTTI